jgi:hypothetical protein
MALQMCALRYKFRSIRLLPVSSQNLKYYEKKKQTQRTNFVWVCKFYPTSFSGRNSFVSLESTRIIVFLDVRGATQKFGEFKQAAQIGCMSFRR